MSLCYALLRATARPDTHLFAVSFQSPRLSSSLLIPVYELATTADRSALLWDGQSFEAACYLAISKQTEREARMTHGRHRPAGSRQTCAITAVKLLYLPADPCPLGTGPQRNLD